MVDMLKGYDDWKKEREEAKEEEDIFADYDNDQAERKAAMGEYMVEQFPKKEPGMFDNWIEEADSWIEKQQEIGSLITNEDGEYIKIYPESIEDEDRRRREQGPSTPEHQSARTWYSWYQKVHNSNLMFNTIWKVADLADELEPDFMRPHNFYESRLDSIISSIKKYEGLDLIPTKNSEIELSGMLPEAMRGVEIPNPFHDPDYVDPYKEDWNKDPTMSPAPVFDKYRQDHMAWMDLTFSERDEVRAKAWRWELDQERIRKGISEYEVDEKGALKSTDMSEVGSWVMALASPETAVAIPSVTLAYKGVLAAGGTTAAARKAGAVALAQGMALAGVMVGVDNAMYQAVTEGTGEINPKEVGMAAALGASMAAGMGIAGAGWSKFVNSKWHNGVPVTDWQVQSRSKDLVAQGGVDITPHSKELAKLINKNAVDPDDFINIHKTREMSEHIFQRDLSSSVVNETLRKVAEYNPVVLGDMVRALLDLIKEGKLSADDIKVLDSDVGKDLLEKGFRDMPISKRQEVATKLGFDSPEAMVEDIAEAARMSHDPVFTRKSFENMEAGRLSKNDWYDRTGVDKNKQIIVRPIDLEKGTKKIKARLKRKGMGRKARPDKGTAMRRAREQAIVRKLEIEQSVKAEIEAKEMYEKLQELNKQARNDKASIRGRPGGKQAGSADPEALKSIGLNMALPVLGGLAGATDEEHPFIMAMGGMATGVISLAALRALGSRYTRTPIGLSTIDRLNLTLSTKALTSRAYDWLPMIPEVGDLLRHNIRAADNWGKHMTSRAMGELSRVVNKSKVNLKEVDIQKNVIAVLRKQELPKDKGIAKVVTHLETVFDKSLLDMKRAGLIDNKQFKNIKAHRSVNGFFPGVINEGLLSTTPGRKMWMKYFTENAWEKDVLTHTIKVLDKDMVTKGGEVKPEWMTVYTGHNSKDMASLTELGAKELYLNRSTNPISVMHSQTAMEGLLHNDQMMQVLQPFLATDIGHITQKYLDTVHNRVGFANRFGADDAFAEELFNGIAIKGNKQFEESAREIYYAAKHDIRSVNIAAAVNAKASGKAHIAGKAQAFNTLLLSFAPFLNMLQASLGGAIFLAKLGHGKSKSKLPYPIDSIGVPYTTLKTTVSSIVHSLNKQNKLDLLESSAAAMHMSTMAALGDSNTRVHSIIGRQITGHLSILERINNPSEFLRTIQFINIEEFQRSMGAYMGEAAGLDLVARKIKLEANGKENTFAYKEVLEFMHELGMDTNIRYKSVDEVQAREIRAAGNQLSIAALNFSDEINFANTALFTPIWLQHPAAGILRQFMSYSMHFGSFMRRNVLMPAIGVKRDLKSGKLSWKAARSSLLPLAMFLAVGTVLGSAMYETMGYAFRTLETPKQMIHGEISNFDEWLEYIKDEDHAKFFGMFENESLDGFFEWIMSDDDELSATTMIVNALGTFGATGAIASIIESGLRGGPAGALESASGPTLGRAFKLGEDVYGGLVNDKYADLTSDRYLKDWEAMDIIMPFYDHAIYRSGGKATRALLPSPKEIEQRRPYGKSRQDRYKYPRR